MSSRQWFALYSDMLRHPKYRRLSLAGRAGLLHVLLLAGVASPEATWTHAELEELLVLDGFVVGEAVGVSAQLVISELIERGWLDEEEDGALTLHNWDKWQRAVTQAAHREWEASRKRGWRNTKKPSQFVVGPHDRSPGQDTTSQDITSQDITSQDITSQDITSQDITREEMTRQDSSPGPAPDMSGTRPTGNVDDPWSGFSGEWSPVREAMARRGYLDPPSGDAEIEGSQRDRMWQMVRENPLLTAHFVTVAPAEFSLGQRSLYELVGYVFGQWNAKAKRPR